MVLQTRSLEAGTNVILSITPTSIIINATGEFTGTQGTNAYNGNQFSVSNGTNISIKVGSLLTNIPVTGWLTSGIFTNTGIARFTGAVAMSNSLSVTGDVTISQLGNLITPVLQLVDDDGGEAITIIADSSTANYTITLPTTNGLTGQTLVLDPSGSLKWGTQTAVNPTNAYNGNQFLVSNGTNISIRNGTRLTNVINEGWSRVAGAATNESTTFMDGAVIVDNTLVVNSNITASGFVRSTNMVIATIAGANSVSLKAHPASTTYVLTWPSTNGGANETLLNDGSGILSWGAGVTHLFNTNQFGHNGMTVSFKNSAYTTNLSNFTALINNGELTNNGNVYVVGNVALRGDGVAPNYTISQYGGSGQPTFFSVKAGGTLAAPAAVTAGTTLGDWRIQGQAVSTALIGFQIRPVAVTTWTDSSTDTIVPFTVGSSTGSGLPATVLSLRAFVNTNHNQLVVNSNLIVQGSLRLNDDDASAGVTIQAADTTTTSYTLTLPTTNGVAGQWLATEGGTNLTWTNYVFNDNQFAFNGNSVSIETSPNLTNAIVWGSALSVPDGSISALNGFITAGAFRTFDVGVDDSITILAPTDVTESYTLRLPESQGDEGQVLTNSGTGFLGWWTPTSGGGAGGGLSNAYNFNSSQFLVLNDTNVSIKVTHSLTSGTYYAGSASALPLQIRAFTNSTANTFEIQNSNGNRVVWVSSNNVLHASNIVALNNLTVSNQVILADDDGSAGITIQAAGATTTNYTLTFPTTGGADGQVITNNGSGVLGWWTVTGLGGASTPYSHNLNQFLVTQATNVSIVNGALTTNLVNYTTFTNVGDATVIGDVLLQEEGTSPDITLNQYGGSGQPGFLSYRSGGTVASPTALPDGQGVGNWRIEGMGTTVDKVALQIRPVTVGAWTDTASEVIVPFMIGSSNSAAGPVPALTLRSSANTNHNHLYINSNAIVQGAMVLQDDDSSAGVTLKSADTTTTSYTLTLPATNGNARQWLYLHASGSLAWTNMLFNPLQFSHGDSVININGSANITNMQAWEGIFVNSGDIAANTSVAFVKQLQLMDADQLDSVSILPAAVTTTYTVTMPPAQGADGQVLTNNGLGTLGWWTPIAGVGGGGGITNAYSFNANQFGQVNVTNISIKSSPLLTNVLNKGWTEFVGPITNKGNTFLEGDSMIGSASSSIKWNNSSAVVQYENVSEIQRFPGTIVAGGAVLDDILGGGASGGVLHTYTLQNALGSYSNRMYSLGTVQFLDTGFDSTRGAWTISPGSSATVKPLIIDGVMEENFPTNTLTFASLLNVPMNTNSYQLVVATGNLALNTTNRNARPGVYAKHLRVIASGGDRTVTLNSNWRVFGANPFTVASGKQAHITLKAHGTTEAHIEAFYEIQDQVVSGGSGGFTNAYAFNANQFGSVNVTNISIKNGAFATNMVMHESLILSNLANFTNFGGFNVQVSDNVGAPTHLIELFSSGGGSAPTLNMHKALGTAAVPLAVGENNPLFQMAFDGQDLDSVRSAFFIQGRARGTWNANNAETHVTITIGSSNNTEAVPILSFRPFAVTNHAHLYVNSNVIVQQQLVLNDDDFNAGVTLEAAATTTGSGYTLTFPAAQATVGGQVLTNDGLGILGWWTPTGGAGGGLSNAYSFHGDHFTVINDTNVSIKAGPLITNGIFRASSTTVNPLVVQARTGSISNTFVVTDTNLARVFWVATNQVTVASNMAVLNSLTVSNDLILADADGSAGLTLMASPTTISYPLTFPPGQATVGGQVMTNDGAGILGWWTPTGGAGGGLSNAYAFHGDHFTVVNDTNVSIKAGPLITNGIFRASTVTANPLVVQARSGSVSNTFVVQNAASNSVFWVSSNSVTMASNVAVLNSLTVSNDLVLVDSDGSATISLMANPTTTSYSLSFPPAVSAAAGNQLISDASGNLSWGLRTNAYNGNQFTVANGTNVAIKVGVLLTNTTLYGLTVISNDSPGSDISIYVSNLILTTNKGHHASIQANHIALGGDLQVNGFASIGNFKSPADLRLRSGNFADNYFQIRADTNMPFTTGMTMPTNNGAIGKILKVKGAFFNGGWPLEWADDNNSGGAGAGTNKFNPNQFTVIESGTNVSISAGANLTNLVAHGMITNKANVTWETNAVPFGAQVHIDFRTNAHVLTLTGDTSMLTTNRIAGRMLETTVLAKAGTANRNVIFHPLWIMMAGSRTNLLGSNRVAIVTLRQYGPTESDVLAAWAPEQ